jgi:hypothetical protein
MRTPVRHHDVMAASSRRVLLAAAGLVAVLLVAGVVVVVRKGGSGTRVTTTLGAPGSAVTSGSAVTCPPPPDAPFVLPPGVTVPPIPTTVPAPTALVPLEAQATPLPGLPPEGDPSAAKAFAARLLTAALLPAGARSTRMVPPALQRAQQVVGSANLVDRGEAWLVDEPLSSVDAYVSDHVPGGMSCGGSSSSGGPGSGRSESVTQTLDRLPSGIQLAQLLVQLAPVTATESAVRVDAQVVFLPPKSPAEQVPASDRVVVIQRTGSLPGGGSAAATVTVTDPTTVQKLVGLLDGLDPQPPSVESCPAELLSYRLAFAPSVSAAPNYVATIGSCDTVVVSAGVVSAGGSTLQPALGGAGVSQLEQFLGRLFAA